MTSLGTSLGGDGCVIHPTCLTCPLPECVYEPRGGIQRGLAIIRQRAIIDRYRAGSSLTELADAFHVSLRTVYRHLESEPRRGVPPSRESETPSMARDLRRMYPGITREHLTSPRRLDKLKRRRPKRNPTSDQIRKKVLRGARKTNPKWFELPFVTARFGPNTWAIDGSDSHIIGSR